MTQKTAVELLFSEFKALSNAMRDSGDIASANLIDFLCERESVAKEMEKEQHEVTWIVGRVNHSDDDYIGQGKNFEQYYNETFGGNKEATINKL